MSFLDQFRDPSLMLALKSEIEREVNANRIYKFMEVCGTHTMSIFKYGIRSILPKNIHLLSGPGCPVCVTPVEFIDTAIEISKNDDTILTTFGDMLKVPGTKENLYKLRTEGYDIRYVYSPIDAIKIAQENSFKLVVFIAVGFETTSPTTASSILLAEKMNIDNFFVLCGHKTMPNAMSAMASSGDLMLDGFICPPHVSAITGTKIYDFLATEHSKACVVGGFEPTDLLQTILMLIKQVNMGKAFVENQYSRVVNVNGNEKAQTISASVFESCDSIWRGIGNIPQSGLKILKKFSRFNALNKFTVTISKSEDNPACLCGEVLAGRKIPTECSLFANVCNPENPKGACMVSSEGTCAAYYKYNN
jgi:hydrogenase expression/formation protein HypD